MNHLDTIKDAYDKCGILYVVRRSDDWSYLFLCNKRTAEEYRTADLETLLRNESFMEFLDGTLASY